MIFEEEEEIRIEWLFIEVWRIDQRKLQSFLLHPIEDFDLVWVIQEVLRDLLIFFDSKFILKLI